MLKLSFKIYFLIILLLVNLLSILIAHYYKYRYENLKKELTMLKNEYELLNKKYTECYSNMEKMKVDYTQRLKEFIKKYNKEHRFDRLKQIPLMRGDRDECEQIKEMLDIYREIENSGYFDDTSNRSVFTSTGKNKD